MEKVNNCEITKSTLEDRLWYLRTQRNISVKYLHKMTGIPIRTIYRYESGDSIPSMADLKSYAKFFHVSLNYLFYGTNQTSEYSKDSLHDLSEESKEVVQNVIDLIVNLEMSN